MMLEIEHVSKAFTGHQALDDVSLSVPKGSVYGLLGPNGAGKTTLLRIINHITAPDSGCVKLNGHIITEADTANIGYLPEERGLYKKMRVGEQAVYFARLKGLSKADATARLHEWFDRFGIADWWGKKIEELSKGMAQKVQFIVTVLHRPELLIFDEPFSGFDPINANLLKEEILRLRDEGSTILFSTHNMNSVEEICDHITLLNHGHNILTGKVDEVRAAYFGNTYTFATTPEGLEPLTAALMPLAAEPVSRNAERPELTVKLSEGVTVRQALDAANRAADIRAFNPTVASMNDVFIRAVKESSNSSIPPAQS